MSAFDQRGLSAEENHAVGGLAGWQVRRVHHEADSRLATLTVGALARAAGLSANHFSQAFRSTFGVPPREWLVQQRMDRARTRLLETADTVEQIALSLGYKSGSQLSRTFRARFGMSPRAYRRA